MEWKYFTAEGMRDHLPADTYARRQTEIRLRELFWTWGYAEVETPEIEFADVYLHERFVKQEALYKFSDPQGRLLALRYDNTVPLARLAATSGRNLSLPLRLSYIGTMFRANEPGGARNHQFEQAGVEFMGLSDLAADGEVLALAITTLQEMGLRDFQISLNQTGFYKALVDEFQLDENLAGTLPKIIDGKEFVLLDSILSSANLPSRLTSILETMMETTGSYEVLAAVRPLTDNQEALSALADLQGILDYLKAAGLEEYVSIDLGLLKNLSYYTGTIFRGYVPGAGQPLLSGGRYDKLCAAFGRDLPATGFSLDLDLLSLSLKAAGLLPSDARNSEVLVYSPAQRAAALREAARRRENGTQVRLVESSSDPLTHEAEEGVTYVYIAEEKNI